jgi:hypothetical protein
VYFQVGLLTTVGLSAKNAILIVEFARELHERGMSAPPGARGGAHAPPDHHDVARVHPRRLAARARERRRRGSQNAIGFAVIGGMLSATVLAIMFVPLFFVLIARRPKREVAPSEEEEEDRVEEVEGGAAHA